MSTRSRSPSPSRRGWGCLVAAALTVGGVDARAAGDGDGGDGSRDVVDGEEYDDDNDDGAGDAAVGDDDLDDGFGEVRWADGPAQRPATIATAGAIVGAVGGSVLGLGMGVATGIAAYAFFPREPGIIVTSALGSGAVGVFVGTSSVMQFWPSGLPPGAHVDVGVGAAAGATIAGVVTAGASVTYVSIAYAGSDCFCGTDIAFAAAAPIAAAGVGALAGAITTVAYIESVEAENKAIDKATTIEPRGPQLYAPGTRPGRQLPKRSSMRSLTPAPNKMPNSG